MSRATLCMATESTRARVEALLRAGLLSPSTSCRVITERKSSPRHGAHGTQITYRVCGIDAMSKSSEDDRCSEGSPVAAELAGNASTRRHRHGGNITSWIVNRESGLGAAEPAYFRVPHRLCTSIESLVDADGLLLRATVLGYTR